MKGRAIIYTEDMKKFIWENQYEISRKELTRIFNEKFNTNFSHENLKSFCLRHNMKNGSNGQFTKGSTPLNKGVKMKKEHYEKCKKTMFKKGNIPVNHREIGSERITKDGYIKIKIAEPNKWKLKHKYIFEKANGKVSAKHCIIFLDQNKLNCELNNLKLITRRELSVLNKQHLIKKNRELNITAINISKAIIIIENVKRNRKKKRGEE